MSVRMEQDSMGEVQVASGALWGAQTQRSLENFPIGGERFPRGMIRALGVVKKAALRANLELGELELEEGVAEALLEAADEVIRGELDEHFPLVVWQTGSGTQTNMNVNEVLANRTAQRLGLALGQRDPVHPNDHVNRSQSSNDVFPTAMHVAAAEATRGALLPALGELAAALQAKAEAWDAVVKLGRTHLQDATPLTVGQEMGAYVAQLEAVQRGIEGALGEVWGVPLGGTAVGTGLNTHPRYAACAVAHLAQETGLPFVPAANRFAGIAAHDALVALHGSYRVAAVALTKLANDVRWLGSGPRGGLGELRLPSNEPGSSIMPGKVNPTQCEALLMVCARVMGNDTSVGIAGASGAFQLNVQKPLIAHALLQSCGLLADACRSFRVRCVEGLELERERIDHNLRRSLMLITALAPELGYDQAARVAKLAHADGSTLGEAAHKLGLMSAAEFERRVVPRDMTEPRR